MMKKFKALLGLHFMIFISGFCCVVCLASFVEAGCNFKLGHIDAALGWFCAMCAWWVVRIEKGDGK